MKVNLELYVVRNQEGKWFRSKGYSGYKPNWVDDIQDARIYGNISAVRGIVTYYANQHPDYGVPDIVQLKVEEGEILEEGERVAEATRRKQEKKEKREMRRKEMELRRAETALEDAKERLKKASHARNAPP